MYLIMKKLTYIITALIFTVSFTVSAQKLSQVEKQALVDLYNNTNGDQWKNSWDINGEVATWKGVTIENNTVVGIKLMFNNLEGSLPASIGNLVNLRTLELSFNKISGNIPAEIGNLTKLKVLAFNANMLEGRIPDSIAELKGLRELHLSSNQLTGFLPFKMGTMTKLAVLNVFDNKLSGNIPNDIAQLKGLKQLLVAENGFNYYKASFLEGMTQQGVAMDIDFSMELSKNYEGLASTVKDENKDDDDE